MTFVWFTQTFRVDVPRVYDYVPPQTGVATTFHKRTHLTTVVLPAECKQQHNNWEGNFRKWMNPTHSASHHHLSFRITFCRKLFVKLFVVQLELHLLLASHIKYCWCWRWYSFHCSRKLMITFLNFSHFSNQLLPPHPTTTIRSRILRSPVFGGQNFTHKQFYQMLSACDTTSRRSQSIELWFLYFGTDGIHRSAMCKRQVRERFMCSFCLVALGWKKTRRRNVTHTSPLHFHSSAGTHCTIR